MYIADKNNYRIRKVTVSTGIISTIAGTGTNSFSGDNGAATSATIGSVFGIAIDTTGKTHFTHRVIFILICSYYYALLRELVHH